MKTTLVFQLPAEAFPQDLATPFSHMHLVIASTFKRTANSGFFVAIGLLLLLLLLLLLFQQDETNVKIFLPVATATDKNKRVHCQLPSPCPRFADLYCGFP
jgi:hypothetical protein